MGQTSDCLACSIACTSCSMNSLYTLDPIFAPNSCRNSQSPQSSLRITGDKYAGSNVTGAPTALCAHADTKLRLYAEAQASSPNSSNRHSRARPDTRASSTNQNHNATKIFSLTTFSAITHSASWIWIVPDGPYFRNIHLVSLGNTTSAGDISNVWNTKQQPTAWCRIFL